MVQVQKVTTFAFLLFIVGIFSTSQTFAQQTHIVDLAGTGDFTSIHAAVEAASSGDTIRVQPDQYAFTADLGAISVDKRLVIIGSGYMPVEDGGTELIDITGNGFFDLTGSADGSVIRGFRVQGADDFLDTESGTSGVTIEENYFIGGTMILSFAGSADTVRSNIFVNGTGGSSNWANVTTSGTNTQIMNNIFTKFNIAASYNGVIYISNGSGVKVFNNLFINGNLTSFQGGIIRTASGAPEIYSNGFANNSGTQTGLSIMSGSPFVTNNGFYENGTTFGLNPVEGTPAFVDFDSDNEELDEETIQEGDYDLSLGDASTWKDTGRTGTPYLDADGSRSDIGIYGGPFPFADGKGAPTIPVVIDFQVSPTTVSPSGTITIKATGRIGSGNN